MSFTLAGSAFREQMTRGKKGEQGFISEAAQRNGVSEVKLSNLLFLLD